MINLPTTQMIGKNNLLFRVSHRFIRTIDSGYDTYYGLNGPAFILVGFGYGILDNLGVTIGHSNFNHEWELGANWLALRQGQVSMLPISVAIHASGSLITTPVPCYSVWRSENFKFNVQASLAHQLSDAQRQHAVPPPQPRVPDERGLGEDGLPGADQGAARRSPRRR
ncbi:MAG: DUF5777 family beta-barrel protein, partial [bacterium]|nr:DUF5777 family beta-barrel protein [bacterium]